MLQVEQVSKAFETGGPILSNVSLALVPGQSVALTGDSGSGKSTFLHICAGLEQADQGKVTLGADTLNPAPDAVAAKLRARHIGLVFQQFNLIPSLSVAQNIAFQARLAQRHDPDWDAALCTQLGLQGLENRFPEELSGGQQQRVAIGRALAGRPDVILADEPTGNLDEATSESVMALFLEIVQEAGAGLLMVTHSESLAKRLEHRLHLRGGVFA